MDNMDKAEMLSEKEFEIRWTLLRKAEEAALYMTSLISDPIPDPETARVRLDAAIQILDKVDMMKIGGR
jgi:hypothetical protein